MRRCIPILIILSFCLSAIAQPSYWFQGFQRQGNAKLAQQYYMLAGSNIFFTYDTGLQHVIINAGGGGGGSTCCASYATNAPDGCAIASQCWVGANYQLLSTGWEFFPGLFPDAMIQNAGNSITPLTMFTIGTVVGGSQNSAIDSVGGMGAGTYNAYVTMWGNGNTVDTSIAGTISGGQGNNIKYNPVSLGGNETIGGGGGNSVQMQSGTVSGGDNNTAGTTGKYPTAGGPTVGGGNRNAALDDASTVSGGENNTADGPASVIAGGGFNTVRGYGSVVSGGYGNYCYSNNSSLSVFSAIGGGRQNTNLSAYSLISGGYSNYISQGSDYSMASGQQAAALHSGVFIWSDASGGKYSSIANNIVQFRAANGLRLDGGAFFGNGYNLTNLNLVAGANVTITTNGAGNPVIAATGGGGSQSPWTGNENANLFSLLNVGPIIGGPTLQLTNTGSGSPFATLSAAGSIGNLTLTRSSGANQCGISSSYPNALASEWDFNVASSPRFIVGFDSQVSPSPRGLVYSPTGANGLYVFDSGIVAIGNDTATPANDAFVVNQPSTQITTKSGISFVVNGTAFGNGIGFTNCQFSSHLFTNSVLVPGVITNINFVSSTNISIIVSNVGGSANIFISESLTNINLPLTTSATAGTINQNGVNVFSTYGTGNLFIGTPSGYSGNFTTTGTYNVGVGRYTLANLTSGGGNMAIGNVALLSCNSGAGNMAIGQSALQYLHVGGANVAIGNGALLNLDDSYSVAIGDNALALSSSGAGNVAIGRAAGFNLTLGDHNTFIGYGAGLSGSQKVDAVNSMALGNGAFTTANNQVVIGNATIQAVINGTTVCTNGFASYVTKTVAITATGWTNTMTTNGIPIDADVYFTGATATLSDSGGTAIYTFILPITPVQTTTVHMHPNWRLSGTVMAGTAVGH